MKRGGGGGGGVKPKTTDVMSGELWPSPLDRFSSFSDHVSPGNLESGHQGGNLVRPEKRDRGTELHCLQSSLPMSGREAGGRDKRRNCWLIRSDPQEDACPASTVVAWPWHINWSSLWKAHTSGYAGPVLSSCISDTQGGPASSSTDQGLLQVQQTPHPPIHIPTPNLNLSPLTTSFCPHPIPPLPLVHTSARPYCALSRSKPPHVTIMMTS